MVSFCNFTPSIIACSAKISTVKVWHKFNNICQKSQQFMLFGEFTTFGKFTANAKLTKFMASVSSKISIFPGYCTFNPLFNFLVQIHVSAFFICIAAQQNKTLSKRLSSTQYFWNTISMPRKTLCWVFKNKIQTVILNILYNQLHLFTVNQNDKKQHC